MHQRQRTFAGDSFDATDAGRNAAFRDDLEEANITGTRHVGTAAQFGGGADGKHAHLVAVLLAEQRHGAGGDGVVVAHQLRAGGHVGQHFAVDDLFHTTDFLGGHRGVVAEVETGLVGIDQRPLLRHMRTQHFAQGLVHQVGGRVVAHGAGALVGIDLGLDGVADGQAALDQLTVVAEHLGLDLLRVRHGEQAIGRFQRTGVAALAAGFGVERRGVQHHDGVLAGSIFCTGLPATYRATTLADCASDS